MCRHRANHPRPTDDPQAAGPRTRRRGAFSTVLTWALGAGVAVVLVNGCDGRAGNHEVESDETRTLPTVGTRKVSVKTDNGFVRVRAAAEGVDSIKVHALIRARGEDEADARDCLDAIEIACPVSGADEATQEIGWAWREPRKPRWQATVSFEVSVPPELNLAVETDNGQIDVVGLTGDCQIKTDNGAIRAVAARKSLHIEATNGSVTVESPASDVRLRTVNGRLRATLTNDKRVAGTISTENGEVRVALAKTAGAQVTCRTSNGRIKNSLPLEEVEKKGRTGLSGQLAGGGEPLVVETTNGSITLEPYSSKRAKRDD